MADGPGMATADGRAAVSPLLLTAREAASALRLSERTLWGLSKAGEIPALRIGRAVRYDLQDLRAWIERRKAQTRPDEKSSQAGGFPLDNPTAGR